MLPLTRNKGEKLYPDSLETLIYLNRGTSKITDLWNVPRAEPSGALSKNNLAFPLCQICLFIIEYTQCIHPPVPLASGQIFFLSHSQESYLFCLSIGKCKKGKYTHTNTEAYILSRYRVFVKPDGLLQVLMQDVTRVQWLCVRHQGWWAKGWKFEFCLPDTWVLYELVSAGWNKEMWLPKSSACHKNQLSQPQPKVVCSHWANGNGRWSSEGRMLKTDTRCLHSSSLLVPSDICRELVYACWLSIDHYTELHSNFAGFLLSLNILLDQQTSRISSLQRKLIK